MKIVIAREVEHEDHGRGTVVIGTHGDLTENGEIPSYDVQWTDSSITQNVPADELSVLDGDELEIDGVEYLDELSRKTLGNYIRKASHDSLQHVNKASQGREAWHHGVNDGERRMGLKQMKAGHRIARNRHLGIDQAARKLSKEQGVSKQRLLGIDYAARNLSKEQLDQLNTVFSPKPEELEESVHKLLDTHSCDNGDKWELHGHAIGQGHEWHAIVKTHTAGKSNKNEWGGYNSTKNGSPKYIRSHWKNIKSSTVGHTPTNISGLAKMKEDVEPIDELSRKTLGNYVKHAVRDVHNQHAVPYGSFNARKVHNRNNNIVYATDRLEGRNKKISKEEFEELKSIEEKHWIAKATENKGGLHRTLGIPEGEKIPQSKINAAAKKGGKEGKEANLAKTLEKMHEESESIDELSRSKVKDYNWKAGTSFKDTWSFRTMKKRKAGSDLAMNKLHGTAKVNAKEEPESIDELSMNKVVDYAKKAQNQTKNSIFNRASNKTRFKRIKGLERAVKLYANEESEPTENSLEEGRGRPKGTFKKPPEGSENPSHPDHKKYKAYQAKVSGHTASNAAKKKAGEKVEDHGDPETSGDRHIISQLQKASVASSREPHHISFDNGKTHPVSKELAKKALGRYSTVAKGHGVASGETGRADHAKHMQKSLEHLHGYAAGHPVTKERKISRDELLAPRRYHKEDLDENHLEELQELFKGAEFHKIAGGEYAGHTEMHVNGKHVGNIHHSPSSAEPFGNKTHYVTGPSGKVKDSHPKFREPQHPEKNIFGKVTNAGQEQSKRFGSFHHAARALYNHHVEVKEDKDVVIVQQGTESPGHEGADEVHSVGDQTNTTHNPIVQGGHGLPGDKYKSMSAFASKNRLPDDLEATIMNILKQKNDIIVKRSYEEFLKGKHNGG